MYKIIDNQTGLAISEHLTRKLAQNKADRLDNIYGAVRYIVQNTPRVFSLEDIEASIEASTGFCVACGEESDCIEPDARNYPCEGCGKDEVFGGEELIIMGYVE